MWPGTYSVQSKFIKIRYLIFSINTMIKKNKVLKYSRYIFKICKIFNFSFAPEQNTE